MMLRGLLSLSALVLVSGGCGKKSEEAGASSPPPPPPVETKVVEATKPAEPPPGPDPKVIERGAYLVKATGCMVCHTAIGPTGPDLEHAFAGGLEMPDPLGTWRSPNITPDKSSGIGGWTDAQIAAAIREGVRPDGAQLFPIMPYLNYNRMTDADVNAIVTFLRTVKPVDRAIAPNTALKMAKVPAPKPVNQADGAGDPVKHGEYLASLMLCSHCHWTPDKNFAPAGPDKMFSGGLPMELPMLGKGRLVAGNITSDPDTGIGKWTEEQIFTTVKTMTRPDGRPIFGPMMFLQAGWSQLDEKDLRDVAAFIHQLPPVKNKVPPSTFTPNPPPAPAK